MPRQGREAVDITAFESELNDLLVKAYGSIDRLEEQMLRTTSKHQVSIREVHLMETVAQQRQACTISCLSASQGISLPSVTAAVNKLCRKGFVEKQRSPSDGRVVHVVLTHEGARIVTAHRYFHRHMVRAVTKSLTRQEREAMLSGVRKLNQFFDEELH